MSTPQQIIAAFRQNRKQHPDYWFQDVKYADSFAEAITLAAKSITKEGLKHPHQYRLKVKVLADFADMLIVHKDALQSAQSFDDLYQSVERHCPYGVGRLAVYDTAYRLAGYLSRVQNRDLMPDTVYLHSGALIGARKLLGQKRIRGRAFSMDHFPEYKAAGIAPWEMEQILCIYKDNFQGNAETSFLSGSRC